MQSSFPCSFYYIWIMRGIKGRVSELWIHFDIGYSLRYKVLAWFYTDLPYPSSTVSLLLLPLGLAQWEFLHPQRFIDTRLYNTFDTENFFLVDQTDFFIFCIVHNDCDAFSDGINIFLIVPKWAVFLKNPCRSCDFPPIGQCYQIYLFGNQMLKSFSSDYSSFFGTTCIIGNRGTLLWSFGK